MEETQNLATDSETSLLDVLVTLAESFKLLIFGPLAVGLCALGICFVLPQTYESVAVLQAERPGEPGGLNAAAVASLMSSASVLDPVAVSLGLVVENNSEEARRELKDQIKVTVNRSEKLLTLKVTGRTAQQAQAIANAVLQQTYRVSGPKGSVRARFETQLAEARTRLKNAQEASVVMIKRLESNSGGVIGGAELARGYAELLSATGAAQTQVSTLEVQLESLSEAHLIQSPTSPEKASKPKKGLITIGATLATGLVLLLFVFLRQAFHNTSVNSAAAGKLTRIRQALGLR